MSITNDKSCFSFTFEQTSDPRKNPLIPAHTLRGENTQERKKKEWVNKYGLKKNLHSKHE